MAKLRDSNRGGYSSSWIRQSTRLAIYLRDGLCCVYCLRDWSESGLTVDHIIPRSAGGTNECTNLVSACMSCNAAKRALGDDLSKMALALRIGKRALLKRLQEQARAPSVHIRNRAVHARKRPPAWLEDLRRLNENLAKQASMSDSDKDIPF